MIVYYMGLESYVARYTYQLKSWNFEEFDRLGVTYVDVEGQRIRESEDIQVGSVLDAHGRSYYSLTQNAELVRLLATGEITSEDVIFYEDMFTPGLESLGYILDQIPRESWPRVYVRCLAQTVDPDDFVNRTGMTKWMRHFELAVDEITRKTGGGILVASEELVAHLNIAGFTSNIYVTGLPFGKREVSEDYVIPAPWAERVNRVCFAARWDSEKQPEFYLSLAHEVNIVRGRSDIEFSVLTGHRQLKSDKQDYLDWLYASNIQLYQGLSKHRYYELLAQSKVLFNCALQDWVSNTVSEADALGCMTLYPAYRSFPEVFANNPAHMYIPWSVQDAADKLIQIIDSTEAPASLGQASDYQGQTIARTVEVFRETVNSKHLRADDYRRYVAIPKYEAKR